MEKKVFRVVFQHCGFMPGKDISEQALEKAHDQYVKMYNLFAKSSDQILDKINDIWHNYEYAKLLSNDAAIKAMQKVMNIDDTYDYNKWLAKHYEEIGRAIDRSCCMYGLKSKIFRDTDGAPHYGVTFMRNPNWSMYITIEEL